MIYECCVVIADGGWGVEQCRQQVLLNVPHLRCVLLHTLQDKLDVIAVQFQKAGAHNFVRKIRADHPGDFPFGADHFQNQFQNLIDGI